MSETDNGRALNEDELDKVVAGADEWWEGLAEQFDLNGFCN